MFLSRPLTARLRPRLLVGVAAGLALSALGTVALATDSPSSNGTITACVKKNGQVRFVSSASQCKRNETATTFNVNGASDRLDRLDRRDQLDRRDRPGRRDQPDLRDRLDR